MQQVRRLQNAHMYFSDRNDGVSQEPYNSLNIGSHVGDDIVSVLKNREILQNLISDQVEIPDHRNWIFLNQTHEPNIFVADGQNYDPLSPPTADASITTQSNLVLATMTADCGPLIISGETIISAVHVSYKTLVAGLIEKVVEEMRKMSDEVLFAFLGPCIYPHTYEFDANLLSELSQILGSHVEAETHDKKPAFNLPAGIRHVCSSLDVSFDEIGINTFSSPNHFSYRRDGITGRQAGLVWLK